MDKERNAPEYVPLLQAVDKIRTSRKCDVNTARQIIKAAHRLGELDLRLHRPDESTDDPLDPNIWDWPWGDPDVLFENGLINAEMRRAPRYLHRPRSLRRVQPMERCRIVVTRESLDTLLKADRTSRAGAPEKHDWDEAKQFLMKELKTKGSPREANQTKGWRSDTDAAKLVIEHLERLPGGGPGSGPELDTVRKKVGPWINEFESGDN